MSRLIRISTVFAALSLLGAASVFAAVTATVESVQAPAWRDRNGTSVPLAPGMELKSGDVLRTGPGARAYVLLAEGSRVKLGESARFSVDSRGLDSARSFRAALDVLAGPFRFTTGKLKWARSRDVAIRVGTSTIGIRGTDLWGRTDASGDLVALLEGRIDITRGGQITTLTQPLSYFDAPHGKESAVKTLDPNEFKRLARQTEIQTGDGAAHRSGAWAVLAAETDSEATALEFYDQIREAGLAVRIRPQARDSGDWNYQLLLQGNFSDADEAGIAANRLKAATELKPKVVRK